MSDAAPSHVWGQTLKRKCDGKGRNPSFHGRLPRTVMGTVPVPWRSR
jgi:hypothetical protein